MTKLQRLTQPTVPPVPRGWLSYADLAKQEGSPESSGALYYRVQKALSAGVLERKQHPFLDVKGRVHQKPIYRFKK